MKARIKRWTTRLLLVSASTVFALLLAEAALRVAGFSHPYFYTFETETGWTLRPNVAGRFQKEGGAYITINSAGMRDREHALTKPANTYRIAVVGDSFAEALQVPMEQTFWRLLESRLAFCPALAGREVEVLNFGVSNYGTAQELLALRARVFAYSPDLVVLAFTPANDVRNNSRALEHDDLRPYFVYHGEQLVADMSFRDAPVFRQKRTRFNNAVYDAINCSRVLQVVNAVKEAIQTRQKSERQEGSQAELGAEDRAFMPPPDDAWAEAWHVTEGIIAEMNRESHAHGAQFLVVSVTYGAQVNPDPAARTALAQKIGMASLLYPGQRLEGLGARENFAVLDLVPPFQAFADQQGTPLHGFGQQVNLGHWNQAGHKLASELIAQRICLLLQNPTPKTLPSEI